MADGNAHGGIRGNGDAHGGWKPASPDTTNGTCNAPTKKNARRGRRPDAPTGTHDIPNGTHDVPGEKGTVGRALVAINEPGWNTGEWDVEAPSPTVCFEEIPAQAVYDIYQKKRRIAMKKRVLSLILTLAMILTLLPVTVFAELSVGSDMGYNKVVSAKEYAISPGVTEKTVIVNDDTMQNQSVCHILEVDLSNKNAAVMPSYSDMNPDVWKQQVMSEQCAAAEAKMGVNVVGAINVNLSWKSNEPMGMLVVNGEVWHEDTTASGSYLVVYADGTAEFRDGNVPLNGTEWQAVTVNFGWLIKNGVNQYPTEDHALSNRAPRTSIGIKEDGTLVLFVVDGRQEPVSTGMTMNELAEAMEAAGCVNAVNCDGGGSSTFLSEREGTGQLTVKNSPSDGVERPTLGGLLVISNAKPTGVFDHASVTPDEEYYTPGSQIQFHAAGVDSSGTAVDLPADASWVLSDSSRELGTIDAATGLFTAGADAVGVVEANLVSGGEVVGSAAIELVKPDEIYFSAEEISLGFEGTTDFDVVVRYNGMPVNYKVGDLIWTLSDERLGTFDGDIFTASDGESLNGTVTVTSAFDDSITDSIHLIVGMLPTIVWDFEDVVDPDTGETIAAEDYYVGTDENPGILTHSNYNRGGNESIEIVSIDDEEPVRMGSHALKLNYDFTEYHGNGLAEGACIGTKEAMEIPGAPTGIGVWVYAPEGVGVQWEGDGTSSGFWLRGYVKLANGTVGQYDFTLEPKAVTGDQQPGIYWEGWKYLEADLTKYSPPFSIQAGMTFRLMYVPGTMMGSMSAGSIYFDNLQFVYGTNVDDVDNPVIKNVTANGAELTDGAVLNTNTITFQSEFYDVINKYTSGIDTETVRMYIDGINTYDSEDYNFAVNPDGTECYLYNVELLNGQHSITVSMRDAFGNETSETTWFTVAGEDSTVPTAAVKAKESAAMLGGQLNLEVTASDASSVDSCSVSLKLSSQFDGYTVTFSEDYEGSTSYNKLTGLLTIKAARIPGASSDSNVIATLTTDVDASLKETDQFAYTVKAGQYTVSGETYTFSASEAAVPVSGAYQISVKSVIVGAPAVINVTFTGSGIPASDVGIYLEDGTILGTTDENGQLLTEQFSAAPGITVIYAKDSDGKLSFLYKVTSCSPNGDSAVPFAVKHNVTSSGATGCSISWMSNPLLSGEQVLQYAEEGSDSWITVPAATSLSTFVGDGYSAVNVSSATVTGLTPETTYRYRVGDGESWTEEATFTTGHVGNGASFFALGDIQAEDITNVSVLMDYVKQGDYDFGIQTGDAVDDASRYEDWMEVVSLFGAENLGSTPMLQVLGNHEFSGDAEGLVSAAYYAQPDSGMGSYYSVTYGNVYVAVINYTATKAQLQSALDWLEKDAAESNADWKILTMHQPAYYTNVSGGNAEIQAMVPAVVDRCGIDFVFSGHDHSYARTEPLQGGTVSEDGAVYFICGSSGEKSYSVTDNPDFHFAKATQEFTAVYLSVEADWNEITVTAYDVQPDGTRQVLDTYTKSNPRCANDDHSYLYYREDDLLVCEECGYTCVAAEDMYTGFVTDAATGRLMYFVTGAYLTGYQYISSNPYYFTDLGLGFEGVYTIGDEKCLFEDGQYVSCSTAEVLLAGMCGEKAEFVLYADGKLEISGSGDMCSYTSYGVVPWSPLRRSITSIWIGRNITSIGSYSFRGAGKCTSVTFEGGSKLERIGAAAFYYNSALKDVKLPNGVRTISSSAFGYCTSLESVWLPDEISRIADTAFGHCDEDKLVLSVLKDSYAHEFAETNHIRCVLRSTPVGSCDEGHDWVGKTCSRCGLNIPFEDVAQDRWFFAYVAYNYERGLVKGTSDTTFSPYQDMTRGQLMTILYRIQGEPEVYGDMTFQDVPEGTYYHDGVLWAYQNGIANGWSAEQFDPNGSLTRAQLVTFLYRYAAFVGADTTARTDLSVFTDDDWIPGFAREAMNWAVAEGIVNGIGDHKLDPNGNAQRNQLAKVIALFCINFNQ